MKEQINEAIQSTINLICEKAKTEIIAIEEYNILFSEMRRIEIDENKQASNEMRGEMMDSMKDMFGGMFEMIAKAKD